MTSCKDLLEAKKIGMTFYGIMESISHLKKKWLELIAEKRQCVIYSQLADVHAPL